MPLLFDVWLPDAVGTRRRARAARHDLVGALVRLGDRRHVEALARALAAALGIDLVRAARPPRPSRARRRPRSRSRRRATSSGADPSGKAITGVPHAIASVITRPNGSGQRIGMRNARAPRVQLELLLPDLADVADPVAVDVRLDLAARRSPPGPAARARRARAARPASRAAAIARCGPLSSFIRPIHSR